MFRSSVESAPVCRLCRVDGAGRRPRCQRSFPSNGGEGITAIFVGVLSQLGDARQVCVNARSYDGMGPVRSGSGFSRDPRLLPYGLAMRVVTRPGKTSGVGKRFQPRAQVVETEIAHATG